MATNHNGERRKHRRIRINTGALVFNYLVFGELIDIGKNGLAFSYRGDKKQTLNEFLELDILCGADSFFLSKIPCRTISDIELSDEAILVKRRRGVQFGTLAPEQLVLLEHFFTIHANEPS